MIKLSKKRLILFFSVLALLCVSYICYKPCTTLVNSLLPDKNSLITIVVDPGHGGYDPGKVGGDGTLEKDINLAIGLYLKSALEESNYNVVMTREDDTDLCQGGNSSKKTDDLNHRIAIIDEASPKLVISIHQNSFQDSSVSGAQVFYYGDGADDSISKNLGETLQSSLVTNLDSENHRVAKSNTSYYMLKKTAYPTVIVECGFLSNPNETVLLNTDDYQQKIAQAITLGVNSFVSSN